MCAFDSPLSIFSIFFRINCNCNKLKQILIRIRTTIRARAIVTVEKCAREAASLGAIGHRDSSPFSSGGSLFLKRFSEWFFLKNDAKMEPQMASKRSQHLIKNELETKSTKHVENVINLTPLDLQETRFRMEGLSKITKTRGADKSKTIQKNSVEMKPRSMKNRLQNSTKNDA